MCIKKVKVKKVKVKKIKSNFKDEFLELMRKNLEDIQNEPKMDFSGIKQIK